MPTAIPEAPVLVHNSMRGDAHARRRWVGHGSPILTSRVSSGASADGHSSSPTTTRSVR